MDIRRPDIAWFAGLGLASAALPWVAGRVLDLAGPAGTDPALWTLSALDLTLGNSPTVSPLYPALVALAHGGTGHAMGEAVLVTAASIALVGPLTYLLARVLGARSPVAGLAAVAALLTPAVAGFSVRVGPDALVAAAFAGAVLAAVWFARAPERWPRLVALGAVAALATLVREHGLVLAACLVGVAALAPGSPRGRAGRALAVVLAVLAAPLVVGQLPRLPWELVWNGRLFHPVGDLTGAVPKYAAVLRPELLERLTALYADGDRPGIVLFHLEWALRQDPGTWVAVLLAVGSLVRLRRAGWAAGAGLLPVLPALVVWSAPRHVGVALPVVAAVLAAAWGGERGWRRGAVIAGAAVLALSVGWRWPVQLDALRAEARGIQALERTGQALCEAARPGDFAVGEAEAFVYCPMHRHHPLGDGSAADWRTWWVILDPSAHPDLGELEGDQVFAVQAPSLPWARVWLDVPDRFQVYRLAPWVGRRPCQESTPHRDLAYFPNRPAPVAMDPPCIVDPWSLGSPPDWLLEESRDGQSRSPAKGDPVRGRP